LAQQMLKTIRRSRMDGIRWLSTLSRRTLIAESDFGLAHWDRLCIYL